MRSRSAWLTVCSVVLLAGCGGGSDNTFTTTHERTTTAATTAPAIEGDVAEQLAGRSDEIAQQLDAGDTCGAAHTADRLRNELTAAINAGAIPALYLEDLSSSVNELQAHLQCNPPAEEDDHGTGKGSDKEKKDKKHDGEDD